MTTSAMSYSYQPHHGTGHMSHNNHHHMSYGSSQPQYQSRDLYNAVGQGNGGIDDSRGLRRGYESAREARDDRNFMPDVEHQLDSRAPTDDTSRSESVQRSKVCKSNEGDTWPKKKSH